MQIRWSNLKKIVILIYKMDNYHLYSSLKNKNYYQIIVIIKIIIIQCNK